MENPPSGLLRLLECTYHLGGEHQAWAESLAAAAAPLLDQGLGVSVSCLGAGGEGPWQVVAAACARGRGSMRQVWAALPPEWLPALWAAPAIHTVSQVAQAVLPAPVAGGVARDALLIKGAGSGRQGVVLAVPLAEARLPSRQEVQRWTRVAHHLAAAWRLRLAVRATSAISGETILSPEGRDGLRQAVKVLETISRLGPRPEPTRALAQWRALVAERWSLVDHFESHGRHYIVARRPPAEGSRNRLSARELVAARAAAQGCSNKQIAGELGVTTSTVATLLLRACRKLGARNRVELVWRIPAAA